MTRANRHTVTGGSAVLLAAAALLLGCIESQLPAGDPGEPVDEREPREVEAHLEPVFLEDGSVSREHPEHQATVLYHGDSVRFVCESCPENDARFRVVRIEPLRDKMRSVLSGCADAESMVRMLPTFDGGELRGPLFGEWTPPDFGQEAVTTPGATDELEGLESFEIYAVTFEVKVGEAAPVEIDPHIRVHGGGRR